MKIVRVESFIVPYVETNDHDSTRFVCLVRIESSTGAVGWGEAVTLFEEATHATAALIDGWVELLIGLEATPEAAGLAIRTRAWWYGEGGISSFALSAIDIALWDIVGRENNRSLLEMLGGPMSEQLPVLTSAHATLFDLVQQAEEIRGWVVDSNSQGIKIAFGKNGNADLGRDFQRDVKCIHLIREALGPSAKIMVDIGARIHWSVSEALDRARAFEGLDVAWLEEPLGADDPHGYVELKSGTTVPIAYGEREWTVSGIRRIVSSGTVDVVGIDPGRCEGISGFRAAAAAVAAAGAQVNAHAFAGPITYAASLALSLAAQAAHQLEVPPKLNELYHVVGLPPRPLNGWVTGNTSPGLGFEIDEEMIREHVKRGGFSA